MNNKNAPFYFWSLLFSEFPVSCATDFDAFGKMAKICEMAPKNIHLKMQKNVYFFFGN